MGAKRVSDLINESMINDSMKFLEKKPSMINESMMGIHGAKKSKATKVRMVDAMAEKAMARLGIPAAFRKSVLWLAWHRSEARFWEMVEAASADGVTSPGRYFIASIKRERQSSR